MDPADTAPVVSVGLAKWQMVDRVDLDSRWYVQQGSLPQSIRRAAAGGRPSSSGSGFFEAKMPSEKMRCIAAYGVRNVRA
jgi:hypothetical protein